MKRIAFLMLMACMAFCAENILLNPNFSELNPQKTAPLYWSNASKGGVFKSTSDGVVLSNPTVGEHSTFTQQLKERIEIGIPYTLSAKIKAESETEAMLYVEYTIKDPATGKTKWNSFGASKFKVFPNWIDRAIPLNVPVKPESIYLAVRSCEGIPVTFKDLSLAMAPCRKAMGGYWNLDNQVEIVEDGVMVTNGKPANLMKIPVEPGKTYLLSYMAQGIGETGNDYPFHEIIVQAKPYGITGGYFFNDVRNVPMPKMQKLVIPANATYKTIDFVFTGNTKGKIHFYDFKFGEFVPDPKDSWRFFIDKPCYRDTIYESHDDGVIAGSIDASAPAAKAVVSFMEQPEITVELANGKGTFEFPAKSLKYGKYPISCKLLDAAGKELKAFTRTITKVPRAKNEVIGSPSRYFLLNGKPFFPVTQWTMVFIDDDAALYQSVKNGINTVFLGIGTDNAKTKKTLDRFEKFGMKAIIVSSCCATMSPKEHEDFRKKLEKKLPPDLRQHPAIFAYFMTDEPLWGGRPSAPLAATFEILKDFDPYHPVWINAAPRNEVEDLIPYGECCDIFGVDIYPVPYPNSHSGIDDKGLTSVGKYTRRMLDTTFWRKANWMALQGFAWAALRKGSPIESHIYPTDTQQRFMAYDTMLNGCTGYGLWGTHRIYTVSFYDTIHKVTRELHAMSGLYTQGKQEADINTGNADVRVVPFTYTKPSTFDFWPFKNKTSHYFAVMNMVDKDSTVTFDTGLDTEIFTNYEAKDYVVAANGKITLSLKPYEVVFFGDSPLPEPAYKLPEPNKEFDALVNPIADYNAKYLKEQASIVFYKGSANWIWNSENKNISACRTLVKREFDVTDTKQKAMLCVAADDFSTVYFNGKLLGKTENWNVMFQFDLTGKLQSGKNTIIIDAEDAGSLPCGVLAELQLEGKPAIVTDKSWLGKPIGSEDAFDPNATDGFKPVIVLTPYGGGAWGTNVGFKK